MRKSYSCSFLCRWRERIGTSPSAACRHDSTIEVAPTRRFSLLGPVLLLLLLLVVAVAPAPSSALTTDGALLLAFKYAVLSDPLSVLASWNYDDDTPCAWNGVACAGVPSVDGSNDTSRVVSLVLPNAQLLGSVAPDLGLIPHLRHLDLSGNSLNGTLPSTLFFPSTSFSTAAAPSELRVLSLASNEISGELPVLSAGAELINLQVLNLSDNALTGRVPPGLALLPNLTALSLAGNYLSGALPSTDGGAGGFPRAEYVDLSSNLLNGTLPPDFAAGGTVRYLNLSYNRLGGEIPAGFAAKFPRSAVVDLSFNNLTGAIPASGPLLDQKPRAFAGNPELCGLPLKTLCPIPSTRSDPPHNATGTDTGSTTPAAGANSPPAFAAIPKTVDGTSPGGGGSKQATGQRGLKPAAIVGIIAGDLGGIGLLFLVFLYVYQAKRKKRLEQQQQQFQQQHASREVGTGKAMNLGVGKQQQWASTPATMSTSATTAHNAGGGLSLLCLGRKSGTTSDESEETSTASDTEADGVGKAEDDVKLQKGAQKQPPQQSGVLVTVDGETELELETLLKASAYILGATGSSIVYKAVLADGTALAVRRIGESSGAADRLRDFEAQVRGVAKLRHPNLLGIRGFYWGADEKLLIYDYAHNGSLANISYRKMGSSPYHLPWETRLRVARGVARGLAYLHEKKYVHGNIKPSNILLGHDMDAMIGDFGIERLTSADGSGKPGFSARHFGSKRSTLSQNSVQEAYSPAPGANASPSAAAASSSSASPYHAPESLKNLKPSPKWDVYSFGVVLLELLTGRVFSEEELCQWNAGFPSEERNRVLRMADPAIREEVEGKEEALLSCFRLGFSCGSVAPQKRPPMKEASQLLDRMPSLPFSPSLPA